MKTCPICNKEINMYEGNKKKFCNEVCIKASEATNVRIKKQRLLFNTIMSGAKCKRCHEIQFSPLKNNLCQICHETINQEEIKMTKSKPKAETSNCETCGCEIPLICNKIYCDECRQKRIKAQAAASAKKQRELRAQGKYEDGRVKSKAKPINPKWTKPRGSKQNGKSNS